MKTGRVLDSFQLNRAVLGRQLLLRKQQGSLPGVLEQMGGLQAQYAPSSYVGLWSRRVGMERADLDRALHDRTVVQGTLMRVTIHLVSRQDYWPFAVGLRTARRQMWLRAFKGRRTVDEMRVLADQTRELLAAGPRKRQDLLRELGGLDNGTWIGIGLWVDLVRVPPSGTWGHRRADLYGLAESWLGPPDVSEEEGIDHLIRRYLGAFGPASTADLASWSGLPGSMLAGRVREIDVVPYRDVAGKELLDLPDAPLPDAGTPAPIRFLPTWDATLLVHCRRAAILSEEYRPRVFSTHNPQSIGTFLVDGKVAGTWKFDKGRVETAPFEPLNASAQDRLEQEAKRLRAFMK